jgi:hypothetical protein
MLSAMPTVELRTKIKPMALGCAGAFVLVNVFFYFLSASYFDSHTEIVAGAGAVPSYSPAQMMQVRTSFAIFAAVVAGVSFVAALKPREIGHLLPVPFGLVFVISAFPALMSSSPPVLGMTWLIAGALMLSLSWWSYRHRSRPAWAFLIALCAVFAIAELFGAPKIARALDVRLWIAMIDPALKVVAVIALSSLRDDYREAAAAAAPATA